MRSRSSFWKPFITDSTTISAATPSASPSMEISAMKEMKRLASGRSRSMYRPVSPFAFATAGDAFQLRLGSAQAGKTTGAFTLDKGTQCFLEQGTAFLDAGKHLRPAEKGFIKRDGSTHGRDS
jgi:hypothetical protein